jgi:hypothetical protein
VPYTADPPRTGPSTDELRTRIPGWGADLDPADRPAVPRERLDPGATGAHWDLPEQQPELVPRERSIEHARLTPVFGTTCPPRGISGALRRRAFVYSEARAAHWLMLLAADRVDVAESRVGDLLRGRVPAVLPTGLRSEVTHRGLASRRGTRRVDLNHQWMDPLVTAGPALVAGAGAVVLARRALRRAAA